MNQAWFYRDGPGTAELGPVSKSDLDYLRAEGTIRPGMEVRSEFGDWAPVRSPKSARPHGSRYSPASGPRTNAVVVVKEREQTLPLLVNDASPEQPDIGSRKRLIAGIATAIVLLCLLLFFLLPRAGSGLNSGDDMKVAAHAAGESSDTAHEGTAEKVPTLGRNATDQAADSAGQDDGATSQSQAEVAGTDQADESTNETGGSGDEPTPEDGTVLLASGSAPLPLDRNVKQRHVISQGAEFFGLRATGSKFVFLIDASGSMADGKDVAARNELTKTVRRMTPQMQIEVLFFTNTITRTFQGYQDLRAPNNVVQILESIQPVSGGTPVMPALTEAIELKPDAIFLLTDGSFDEGDISARLKKLNGQRIPINTIAFVDRAMERVLKQVAKDSGGDYRFVNR